MEMAKKAGTVYKVGNTALINTEIFEAYLEQQGVKDSSLLWI